MKYLQSFKLENLQIKNINFNQISLSKWKWEAKLNFELNWNAIYSSKSFHVEKQIRVGSLSQETRVRSDAL